jgi:hypothetical protein
MIGSSKSLTILIVIQKVNTMTRGRINPATLKGFEAIGKEIISKFFVLLRIISLILHRAHLLDVRVLKAVVGSTRFSYDLTQSHLFFINQISRYRPSSKTRKVDV